MARPPNPGRPAALEYLRRNPGDIDGAAKLVGVTPYAVRKWIPPEERRGRGERGPDRRKRAPQEGAARQLIAEMLVSDPKATSTEIAKIAGTSGQWVRQIRQEMTAVDTLDDATRQSVAEMLYAFPDARDAEIADATGAPVRWVDQIRQEIASEE